MGGGNKINMVAIREHQHEKYNRDSYQEREIVFSSWEAYVEEIKNFNTIDKSQKTYMPVPKGSKLVNIIAGSKYLTFEFTIKLGSYIMNVCHIATLL